MNKAPTRMLLLISVLSATLGMMSVPTAASARTGSGFRSAEFSIRGSNGYLIDVERVGRQVAVAVSRPHKTFFVSTGYAVRGGRSSDGIEANLGKLGKISVVFQPKGRPQKGRLARRCSGKAATQAGVFVGTIEFSGERHYTEVHARRARGRVEISSSGACRSVRPSRLRAEKSQAPLPELSAISGGRIFSAFGLRSRNGSESAFFNAASAERSGRVQIFRFVLAQEKPGSFVFDESLSTATVRPPTPFHGSATFQRQSDGSTSWLGTLSVSFPGVNDVQLAGPGFSAKLKVPKVR
jgi:hypothetical protein